jgi:TetR/AcrR family transcriptional repressor of nem operon
MGQKAEQKQRSHAAILASAATLLRTQGIRASSVGDIMKGAGLTVGGFYGHFASKESLVAATIRQAAGTLWARMIRSMKGASPRERAASVLASYLTRAHRDNAADGCMLPGAAPEIAREGAPYRQALEVELAGFVRTLGQAVGTGRSEAIGLIALMVGALTLARAVAGTRLSDEILRAARTFGQRAVPDPPS